MIPGKDAVLKATAFLLVSFLFFPLIADIGGNQPVVRTMAQPSSIFGPPVMVNDVTTNTQSAPAMVKQPGREPFITWQDSRSGNEDIYVPKAHGNGTVFAPNQRVDDSSGTSKQLEPAITSTANGTLLLTWQDNRRNIYDFDIYFTKSYDGGATFTKNVRVDDSSTTAISWQERPSIAVTTGGSILIAWTDDRSGQLRIRGASSIDGGATFSPSMEIAPVTDSNGQNGVVLVTNGDRLFAAFMDNRTSTGKSHPYVCISTNGGKSFTAPIILNDAANDAGWQKSVTTAPMPDGGIVAVWVDSRNGNDDIYASIASSNGTIITSDFRVDDDPTGAYQLDPCVATDQIGNIYVAWQDERDLMYSVRFAYKLPGKPQFNASVEVATPGNNDIQRRPAIISTDPCHVYLSWEDDKAGTYDVYVATGTIPWTLGLVTGWNLVSFPLVGYSYRASTLGLTNGDTVAQWNPSTQAYQSYVVGVPINDFTIIPSTGYWINVPSGTRTLYLQGSFPTATQQKSITVPAGGGWATVGFSLFDKVRHAKDIPAMYSVPGGIRTVAVYDPVARSYVTWVSMIPDVNNFVLLPGVAYWISCSASGVLTYSVEPSTFAINLGTGWSFVSLPLVGYGYKASTLGLLAGDTVAQWNPATRTYQNHIVGIAVSDFTIAPSTGYWVNVPNGTRTLYLFGSVPTATQSKTVTVPSGGGWVVIGFAGLNMTRHASDIPTMFIGGNVTTVASYNPVTKAYKSWVAAIPGINNFLLVPGQAYWVLVGASGTLSYIP